MSAWRDEKNDRSRTRLDRALPSAFPAGVLAHALSRPLVPPTPRLAVERFWRDHPLRADRLARALAGRSGAPDGWAWRLSRERQDGLASTFRLPPAPYREKAFARGPGHCVVCGQPVFRLGWHRDLWGTGAPNRNAAWHSACVTAWKLWCQPVAFVQPLKKRQARRCALTGGRLFRTAEIDHRVPLHQVWRERRAEPWPVLLGYWGTPNLQVIGRGAHLAKCAVEAGARSASRARLPDGATALTTEA